MRRLLLAFSQRAPSDFSLALQHIGLFLPTSLLVSVATSLRVPAFGLRFLPLLFYFVFVSFAVFIILPGGFVSFAWHDVGGAIRNRAQEFFKTKAGIPVPPVCCGVSNHYTRSAIALPALHRRGVQY
jgi:hypothetical protein